VHWLDFNKGILLYNTLVLPTFLYGSENWTLTALQRRRIGAAEMKLLRPLADYTLYDHKTNDSVCREIQTECIIDKIDEYRRSWLLHLQRMPPNRIPLKSYRYRPVYLCVLYLSENKQRLVPLTA
jgi:hypothetical protein